MTGKKKIAIIHPDLGIGGAENLIINVALALQIKNYQVKIYTQHFDPDRCFAECKSLDIEVRGDFFPRTIFGRLIAFCAYIRMMLCAIWMLIFVRNEYDYIILDQVSFPIPIIRLFNKKILFYCHFPDKLLSTKRDTSIMRFYRYFMDYIEEYTTGLAQLIVVNSNFTLNIFQQHFPTISVDKKQEEGSGFGGGRHLPEILYPSINMKTFEKSKDFKMSINELLEQKVLKGKTKIVTSLNRYERKKNIPLALKAFAKQQDQDAILVIAGGWDPRVKENIEHEQELKELAKSLQISDKVIFLKSISNDERLLLLENTTILLYTPENEHFGIVPVEAMYMGCIVLACDSGGPLESIKNEETGFLRPPNVDKWSQQIAKVLGLEEKDLQQMKKLAKKRVESMFTVEVFATKLDEIVKKLK